jgi:hypothetical protein
MKGINFESIGRSVEGAVDVENNCVWVKVDLNGEPELSSTGKTYVKGTGMLKFTQDINGEKVGHSVRVNFLQNLPKDEYKVRKRAELEAKLAELDG